MKEKLHDFSNDRQNETDGKDDDDDDDDEDDEGDEGDENDDYEDDKEQDKENHLYPAKNLRSLNHDRYQNDHLNASHKLVDNKV